MQIEMKHINKSFGGVPVLRDAQFSLADREIHALMGENGAGKSTLMKILTGVYARDSGEVAVDGVPVNYTHPKQAEQAGIVFIYQELNVMDDLTVEENLFMGKEIHHRLGIVDRGEMRKKAREALEQLGVSIPVNAVMRDLSIGQQQMVEIAKAFMVDAKVLIMDEPTAALTPNETEILFRVIRRLREKGVSTVYISHRMEEIFELCDRITVLRDGQYVGTRRTAETDMAELVRMMIGRDIGDRFPKRNVKPGRVVLEVKGLTRRGVFEGVSFAVHAGEVLGVSGLMGAGRTEIMQAVFGGLPVDGGTVEIEGKPCAIRSPEQAKRLGIGYITEDRKSEGLMLEEPIRSNIALTNLGRVSHHHVIDRGEETKLTEEAIRELSIRCSGPKHIVNNLSGGNQQKVVFAKWIYTDPKVLILDEPTRGVDIGAKKEIYTIINRLAERGVAIVMVSSELPEVLGMSDRVMVVHEGRIRGILENGESGGILPRRATQENIMTLATGGTLK